MAYCDDERAAAALAALVRERHPAWLVDVVQAYVSVAVFYDLTIIDFSQVAAWLSIILPDTAFQAPVPPHRHVIPCCYEFGLDFDRVEQQTGLKRAAIIALHQQTVYTIYAIGFCPGFPYLGYLPPRLAGVPRLPSPRLRVDEGSVGLAGTQTGIYTQIRPGGWNIVGKTPLQLVDLKDGYFPLRTGDEIQFRQIDEGEYRRLRGERIAFAWDTASAKRVP